MITYFLFEGGDSEREFACKLHTPPCVQYSLSDEVRVGGRGEVRCEKNKVKKRLSVLEQRKKAIHLLSVLFLPDFHARGHAQSILIMSMTQQTPNNNITISYNSLPFNNITVMLYYSYVEWKIIITIVLSRFYISSIVSIKSIVNLLRQPIRSIDFKMQASDCN